MHSYQRADPDQSIKYPESSISGSIFPNMIYPVSNYPVEPIKANLDEIKNMKEQMECLQDMIKTLTKQVHDASHIVPK